VALLHAIAYWFQATAGALTAMSKEPRFPLLTLEQLDDAQRPLGEQIVKISRVGLVDPTSNATQSRVWQKMFDLLAYLRWQTSVPLRLNELAILIIARNGARRWNGSRIQRLPREAGLPPDIIAELRPIAGRRTCRRKRPCVRFRNRLTVRHEVSG